MVKKSEKRSGDEQRVMEFRNYTPIGEIADRTITTRSLALLGWGRGQRISIGE